MDQNEQDGPSLPPQEQVRDMDTAISLTNKFMIKVINFIYL